MARYWLYLNNQVLGPFELEQLIRQPGFSRQSLVSLDDYSGSAVKWISPAEIPEMVRIFQKVEELHDRPVVTPPPKQPPKPRIHAPARLTPVPPPVAEPSFPMIWVWLLAGTLLAAGIFFRWNQTHLREVHGQERQTAQALIETVRLPAGSLYGSLRQYLQSKSFAKRWEFERTPAGVYNVMVTWPPEKNIVPQPLFAFEVNLQAETVRGINTAAIDLLAQGLRSPPPPPPPPRKVPGESFTESIEKRRHAFEQGDFDTVWDMFSRRRKDEMSQGGINQAGFTRMQKLTFRSGSDLKQAVKKTKPESETVRLVLLVQTQDKHPEIYIKQRWVWENDNWHLDDEDKRLASDLAPGSPETAAPVNPAPVDNSTEGRTKPAGIPPNLPGLSDAPSRR